MSIVQTAERVAFEDKANNYLYQRSASAYVEAVKHIHGNVLELGTGEGYGIDILMPHIDYLTIIDKFKHDNIEKIKTKYKGKIDFIQSEVPPFAGLKDNSFDCIVSFQVIEHIEQDDQVIAEAYRVLKSGGKLVMTTPNIKTTLTRNPWHIREYTVDQFNKLFSRHFNKVEALGVYGNDRVMEYYERNKASVKKFTRFDIFDLQWKLPRWMLQLPFDILNKMNRQKLLNENNELVESIQLGDFTVMEANDNCFDLFFIGHK